MSDSWKTDVPSNWCWARLGDVAEIKGGLTVGQKRKTTDRLHEVPYLRVANVQRGFLDLAEIKTIPATKAEVETLALQPGDVLFNEGGDRDKLGRGWVWNRELPLCIHQNHVFRARIIDGILIPKLMSWYGNSSGQHYFFSEGKQTTNLASINLTKLSNLPVPIAPLPEQRRIVEAIETNFTKLDAAEATLKRIQSNLKRYRASVLKAAVEGTLVPTEAELAQKENRDYEPASVLLGRILTERRRRWEEAEQAKLKASGKPPKNDAWKKRYQEPNPPDTSNLPPLPEGWCWTTVDQLAADEPNSLCDGPFGSNLKTAHYTYSGPRVIRLQNIGDGFFKDERAHISYAHFDKLKKHSVGVGDVIIASLGQDLPRACIVPESLGPAIVKADCLKMTVDNEIAIPFFAMLALNSPPTRARTEDLIHGVGRPRIGLTLLRQVAIPLPPVSEQARIVAEAERLSSVADAAESTMAISETRTEQLRQSILKLAFEGKLVPQDPNDEPALVLLERLKNERAAGSGSYTTRPRRQGRPRIVR